MFFVQLFSFCKSNRRLRPKRRQAGGVPAEPEVPVDGFLKPVRLSTAGAVFLRPATG